MLEAAKVMLTRHINGLPVTDEGERLVGVICQSDLVAQQKKLPSPPFFSLFGGYIPLTSADQLDREVGKIAAMTVKQAMTAEPVSVGPGLSPWTRWPRSWSIGALHPAGGGGRPNRRRARQGRRAAHAHREIIGRLAPDAPPHPT